MITDRIIIISQSNSIVHYLIVIKTEGSGVCISLIGTEANLLSVTPPQRYSMQLITVLDTISGNSLG